MPGSADFDLTLDELRVVARFAAQGAQEALHLYERAVRGDLRPRTAIEAACVFADGAARTNLQRLAATGANRAATEAPDEASRLAAGSAGDAAAAAYLHPIFRATQVGHILRATARAAHAAELYDGEQAGVAEAVLERALQRATPVLVDVLGRYPPAVTGRACPLNTDGSTCAPGDYAAQAVAVLDNLEVTLADIGASLTDVVSTRVLVATADRADLSTVWAVVADRFGKHDVPSTLVGVTVLGYPDQLVEVEIIAAMPSV